MVNNTFLLDTHILLWYFLGDKQLKLEFKNIIEDAGNTIYVSVGSLWEIFIKEKTGKLQVPKGIEKYIERSGFRFLDIEIDHVLVLSDLKNYHNDPFDRIIISQAISEGLPILTIDKKFNKYNVEIVS